MRVQLELKPYRSPTAARGAGKYTSAAQSSDLGSAAQGGVGSVSAQDCRTGLITRVVLRGADAPQEKPLQWILGKLLSDLSSSPVSGQAHSFTEWDPLSSTLVLHVDSSEEGDMAQPTSSGSHDASPSMDSRKTRSPGRSLEPLSSVARQYANHYFDRFWCRTSDGAPVRYTDSDCWHPGVQAAVASTIGQLPAHGSIVDPSSILAFMQDKAVRQFGEVRNGHKFKRPPSKQCIVRYKATAAAWQQAYGQHQRSGTLPAEISNVLGSYNKLQGPCTSYSGACCLPGQQLVQMPAEYPFEEHVLCSQDLPSTIPAPLMEAFELSSGWEEPAAWAQPTDPESDWLLYMAQGLLGEDDCSLTNLSASHSSTVAGLESLPVLQEPCASRDQSTSSKRKREAYSLV